VEPDSAFRLVVGLGNPGPQYIGTRHNIGFAVLDELARRSCCTFSPAEKWDSDLAICGGRTLMKPRTFMNLSGEAVGNYARYHQIPPDQILVILDDASLPLGQLRLRRSGSSGGHNGLASVLIHMTTELVPRLRVGIGSPDKIPLDVFVLSRFSDSELPAVREAILLAADAVDCANARGLDAAMNLFNNLKPATQ